MIFLWLTHPTKPIDVFRHLEKERFAGVSECVSTQARYTVLYTTPLPSSHKRSNPKASHQKDHVPSSARPLEVPGSDGRATKEQMLPSHFHRSNIVEFYPLL